MKDLVIGLRMDFGTPAKRDDVPEEIRDAVRNYYSREMGIGGHAVRLLMNGDGRYTGILTRTETDCGICEMLKLGGEWRVVEMMCGYGEEDEDELTDRYRAKKTGGNPYRK